MAYLNYPLSFKPVVLEAEIAIPYNGSMTAMKTLVHDGLLNQTAVLPVLLPRNLLDAL